MRPGEGRSEQAHTIPLFAGDVPWFKGLRLPMTVRLPTRVAGLANVAAEATAIATRAHESSTVVFGVVVVTAQIVAVALNHQSTVSDRTEDGRPGLLTVVTAAAV